MAYAQHAMSMKGFADFAGERRRIRDALKAGNDILLFPGDPVAAIEEAMLSMADGTLDTLDINTKCRRVLLAKLWTNAEKLCPPPAPPWEPSMPNSSTENCSPKARPCCRGTHLTPRPGRPRKGRADADLANYAKSCVFETQPPSTWAKDDHVEACIGKDGSASGKREVQSALAQASTPRAGYGPPK